MQTPSPARGASASTVCFHELLVRQGPQYFIAAAAKAPAAPPPPGQGGPLKLDTLEAWVDPRAEWEHIQRVLADCGGNISEAARRLGIHRRSLQRKLHKYPPAR